MVNKYVVINCVKGYKTGKNKSSFHFPEDKDLSKKWIYLQIVKIAYLQKNSVICIDHFEKRFTKYGKNKYKRMWELKPVTTVHVDEISNLRLMNISCSKISTEKIT